MDTIDRRGHGWRLRQKGAASAANDSSMIDSFAPGLEGLSSRCST
jgi:hypothetical protein